MSGIIVTTRLTFNRPQNNTTVYSGIEHLNFNLHAENGSVCQKGVRPRPDWYSGNPHMSTFSSRSATSDWLTN